MLSNLSYRYKIPLALVAAILLTALALALTSAARTYETARGQLLSSAERVGALLADALADSIRKDAVWAAYLSVQTLVNVEGTSGDAPAVVVLDTLGRVFVSSDPKRFPVLAPATDLLDAGDETTSAGNGSLLVRVPIAPREGRLGEVVLLYPGSRLQPPLYDIVRSTAWATLGVLALLVPLAWLWGRRVAAPLVHLADSMPMVATLPVEQIALPAVVSNDEIGRLTERFRAMLSDLAEKREVERRMMSTERLAAVGRLAAGVAHEINNPLGGMLNAISTYRRHGAQRDLGEKTVSLLERGLNQIRETVSALLVEARLETHPLSAEDIEDVRTLVLPEVKQRHARLDWHSDVEHRVALPSTEVRQVLLNLLLNAIHAIDDGGAVSCTVSLGDGCLRIVVENDGDAIAAEQIDTLFEPFVGRDTAGSGLGLWVTYQIVQQFRGEIGVDSQPGLTRFSVVLPVAG